MDVKEAVRVAADYVAALEGMTGAGQQESPDQLLRDIRFAVEGTHYDDRKKAWNISVGFTRPWDRASASPLAGLAGTLNDNRTFKTVSVDDATGRVLAYGSD